MPEFINQIIGNKVCIHESSIMHGKTNLNSIELYYYLFIISLDRCNGSCNTIEDSFMCPMKDLNLEVFNMIKGT